MKQTIVLFFLCVTCHLKANIDDTLQEQKKTYTPEQQKQQVINLIYDTIVPQKNLCRFGQLTKQNNAHTFFSIATTEVKNTSLWKEKIEQHRIDTKTSHFDIADNLLHMAIICNNKKIITYLIGNKLFNINNSRAGECLATPLHTIIQYIDFSRNSLIKSQYLETFTLLLKLGANPLYKNFRDETAVEYAQRKGVLDSIKQHLEKTKKKVINQ